MGRNVKHGICLLSGVSGPFAKSHILPKALTRPSEQGAPLLQSTQGQGFKRKWSNWFDDTIVTRQGEDILSAIDNEAIRILRRHKLVWSGWVPFRPAFQPLTMAFDGPSIRKVSMTLAEGRALHRFVLSIIWRSAASNLNEFSEFTLDTNLMEMLKEVLLNCEPPPLDLFPSSLTQVSTFGEAHNQIPYLDHKFQPAMLGLPERTMKIVRIYMDGLMINAHFNARDFEALEENSLVIGSSEELIVSAVTYERSFQYENLLILAYESTLGPLGSPIK